MKLVAALLLAFLLALFFYYSNLHESLFQRKVGAEIGQAGPVEARPLSQDFTFRDENSGRAHNVSDFKGKVVHLNFWASWCAPCHAELPYLAQLQKDQSDLVIVLINLDGNAEGRAQAKDMQNRLAPNLLATYENTAQLAEMFHVEALPFHYILDRGGRAASAFYAQVDKKEAEFKELLLQLLGETR